MAFLLIVIGLIISFIWLGIITYYIYHIVTNYNALTSGVHKKTLDAVFSNLVQELAESKKDIATLVTRCDTMEKKELFHIQKIGLLRFNPFKDTGGDQSFILTLVDANDTGVVITALYSRSGTRWYAKKVVKGKGLEHDLSEEEKKALRLAKVMETSGIPASTDTSYE